MFTPIPYSYVKQLSESGNKEKLPELTPDEWKMQIAYMDRQRQMALQRAHDELIPLFNKYPHLFQGEKEL